MRRVSDLGNPVYHWSLSMTFESKSQLVKELIAGKKFKTESGSIIYFDENEEIPFRFDENPLMKLWGSITNIVLEEVVETRHVHQILMDSYKEGQAWQFSTPNSKGVYMDCISQDVWVEPIWIEHHTYRLHPHNELIRAHRNGEKIQAHFCGSWVEQPNPDWDEDIRYRIKSSTVILYEWFGKTKVYNKWMIGKFLMDEEEAKLFFGEQPYRKTGRFWEVEV
jgi:hypothetical protein